MPWRIANMWEAVEFMQSRKMWRKVSETSHGGDHVAEGIEFEDHTKVVCESDWSGGWSEYTPDECAEPPKFFIFDRSYTPPPKKKRGER